MNTENIKSFGNKLYQSFLTGETIDPLIKQDPSLTLEDAYEIQKVMVGLRVKNGEQIIGKKIGVTSRAVQDMIGVDQPDFGQLTSNMLCETGKPVSLAGLIQPKAEAEVAFVLKEDLSGPGVTAADVIRATDYVVPCFEIVDSRISNWEIGIIDTVADNASCGVFILGNERAKLTDLDLNLAGMLLERDGVLEQTSCGAAVQGGPVNAVVWLANTLGRLGLPFKKGEIILSGSQSSLVTAVPGETLKCTVGGLASCEIEFSE